MSEQTTFSTVRGTPEEKKQLLEGMQRFGVASISQFFRLCMLSFIRAMAAAKNSEDWPEWPPQFRTRRESRGMSGGNTKHKKR